MTILTDFTNAIESYPHEFLTLSIVEVDPPGSTVNALDDVQFRIQVANSGPLNVLQLNILVEGLNGTLVKSNGAAAQWVSSFTVSGNFFGDVPAHSAATPVVSGGNKFHFKPSTSSSVSRDLLRITADEWNADLVHPLVSHSRADALANDVYSAVVSPQ